MSYVDEADAALRRYDVPTAVDRYEKAYQDDASDRAAAGVVSALWLARLWDRARERLAELDGHATVHAELARGLVALGQPDRDWWLGVDSGSARRDDRAAEAAFAAAIALDPTDPDARAGHATALRMAGRLREAREELESLDDALLTTAPVQLELAICAFEEDDFTRATDHAGRALDREPGSIRAELVSLEIARYADRGGDDLVARATSLTKRHQVRAAAEIHGWILLDRAETSPDKKKTLTDALSMFTKATPPRRLRSGAVSGRVAVLLAGGGLGEAREDVTRALAEESDSPMLHRWRAEALVAADQRAATRLAVFKRVLEFDPRDLHSRLEVINALVDLGRDEEARQSVTSLRAELPGSSRVAKAWTQLATPWRMPDAADVPQRVTRPWESSRDERAAVINLLVDEVVENLSLQPAVADWIRHRVSIDNAVYRPSADEEQTYLHARDQYIADLRVKRAVRFFRFVGTALLVPSFAAASTGVFMLAGRRLLALLGAWYPIVATAGVVVLGAFAGSWIAGRIPGKVFWSGSIVVAAAATAGFLKEALEQDDFTLLFVPAGAVGAFFLGVQSRRILASPSAERAQRAFNVWLESLYGHGLLPIAAEASSLGTTYRTSLPPHCRIVSDTAVELDTPATRELRRLLRQRSKGSFALAGPRGAGKSTLLERWCAGHFLREDDDPRTARHDLTVKVDAPVGYQSQEFLHHLFGQVCDGVEKYVRDHTEPAPPRVKRLWPHRRREVDLFSGTTAAELGQRAVRERENIRYVQSRTAEGEWSAGLPLGATSLGVKGKVSVQRSDVPLNHPELVARFRDFLRTAAEVAATHKGKVLVGIDELDRISDGGEAQRFINELKAVFNVPNCFFLVSVSEDALADFELSAMGMRTVFDSAFDTIVRVDYLDFPLARTLLNRRIIDLPEQFAALAYVLSGGLARELARVAEEIADERSENRSLDAMASYLVRRQLGRTTRAAMDRLNREKAGAALIPVLDEQPREDVSGDSLRGYAEQIATAGLGADEPGAVAAVRLDVRVMITYLAVLLDVFTVHLTEERMATGLVRGLGDFETLARVRRYLGANPFGALELLQAFAKVWGLGPPATA